jgi:hypothetical protein
MMEEVKKTRKPRKPRYKLTLVSESGTGSPAEMWSKLAKAVLGRDVKFVEKKKEVCK